MPLYNGLRNSGFAVEIMADAADAAITVSKTPPNLVILDWRGPDLSASTLIGEIRRRQSLAFTRLILMSTQATEFDICSCFELGADDFIAKPYSLREAVARVRAVMRSRRTDGPSDVLQCDRLQLNRQTRRISVGKECLNVRSMEYRLLEFLMSNRDRVYTRAQLIEYVWNNSTQISKRTVDATVRRLRQLLSAVDCQQYLQTVRGSGYRFSVK